MTDESIEISFNNITMAHQSTLTHIRFVEMTEEEIAFTKAERAVRRVQHFQSQKREFRTLMRNSLVLCIEEGTYASDVNDKYKLVFKDVEDAKGSIYNHFYGKTSYTVTKRENCKLYVNGTEVVFADGETSKEIPLTSGQICVVKYVKIYQKQELNITKKGFGF